MESLFDSGLPGAIIGPQATSPGDPAPGDPTSPAAELPRLLLVCAAHTTCLQSGWWRFSLERADGGLLLEASDQEPGDLNRLTLLAALRGLEAIDGPAAVTLMSSNRYLIRSLSDSLPRWRRNQFVWEHFGRRIDVQHADLWRRVDRALTIHHVQACLVSTRVVSVGQVAAVPAAPRAFEVDVRHVRSDAATLPTRGKPRVDAPHEQPPLIPVRRRRGFRPEPSAPALGALPEDVTSIGVGSDREPEDPVAFDLADSDELRLVADMSDRMRSLLMSTSAAASTVPRRRITAADLLATG